MKKCFSLWTLGVSLVALAGCATEDSNSPKTFRNGAAVNPVPARDKLLWEYHDALTELRRGKIDEAKRLLDDALLSMGGINANDKNAKRSRRLFSGEYKKTFLGEPYERVMAYYYRGILYWMDGEPDNARACFRSAQIQDSDTENKEYSSDYVLLDYLDGLASVKSGGDGSDAFARAKKNSKSFSLPLYDAKANVLFFIDYGSGPLKYATGQYGEELRFRSQISLAHSATIRVETQTISVPPHDDLYFQATTRGGRVMDHILANKAVFKTTTGNVGDAAIVSGAVLAGTQQGRHNSGDEIGLGLAAFGLISKLVSSATIPAADTRYWNNLPQYLSFAALTLSPGQHVAKVEFNDGQGHVLPNLTKTVTINVPANSRDNVIYVSDKSTNS